LSTAEPVRPGAFLITALGIGQAGGGSARGTAVVSFRISPSGGLETRALQGQAAMAR